METCALNIPCGSSESALPMEGMVRMAPLLGLPRLLAAYGLDADAVIREAGCDPALFDDPENTISFRAGGRLLAHAAAVTGCPHLGLELGRHYGLNVLGMVGQATRLAPDLGTGLRDLILHLHLHDRGAVPFLRESRYRVAMGYAIYCPDIPGTEYIYDIALAVIHNIFSELMGPEWRATEIRLFRPRPGDIAPYQRHFRTHLRFAAEHAGIVFPAAQLSRPLPGADPEAYARACGELRKMETPEDGDLASRIRRLLRRLLSAGSGLDGIPLERIARLLTLHPRTLNRRLRAEGTTFSALMAETRYEIARQLLRDTHLQIGDIAVALGYADSASFIHAFRRWSGTSATAWRALHEAG